MRISFIITFLITFPLFAQQGFDRQDSLRGSITPERAWWDLTYYHLDIQVDPDKRFLEGQNSIHYKVLESESSMQIDLQPPMRIEKITQNNQELQWETEGNAHFIQLKEVQNPGEENVLVVHYSGHPKEAVRAPWDGGFSWKRDAAQQHFIATSCQGLGASVWWPNKDHMYDEPDSMLISVKVPRGLMNVSNGRLREIQKAADGNTYRWFVSNPINNYGVNVNIANYVNFKDTYKGEQGDLDLDYFVLEENLEKAKVQFKQVPMMLEAFEHWFGPYPFYEDSFKLVEVPYLGMEHQSSVTYGNQYQNGYLGRDLSGSGWGLKFDFIIIHEAGHEWFANSITYKDAADMWLHEGFTAYSENLYLDYHFGKEAAAAYVIGTRANVRNDRPVIGTYGVNNEGSSDMYYKGANILHTLRQLIEDDELWRQILRKLNQTYYHKTVSSAEVEAFLSQETSKDLSAFFDQYLRTTKIPTLVYEMSGNKLRFKYESVIEDFDMPIRIFNGEEPLWIFPENTWKEVSLKADAEFSFDPNFYIETRPFKP